MTTTTIVITEPTLKDKILTLAEQGFSRQDIAKSLKTTYQQVYQVVRTKQNAFEQTALNRDVLTPRIQYIRSTKRTRKKPKRQDQGVVKSRGQTRQTTRAAQKKRAA